MSPPVAVCSYCKYPHDAATGSHVCPSQHPLICVKTDGELYVLGENFGPVQEVVRKLRSLLAAQ